MHKLGNQLIDIEFVKALERSGMDCVTVVIDTVLLSLMNVACCHRKSPAVCVELDIFCHL